MFEFLDETFKEGHKMFGNTARSITSKRHKNTEQTFKSSIVNFGSTEEDDCKRFGVSAPALVTGG